MYMCDAGFVHKLQFSMNDRFSDTRNRIKRNKDGDDANLCFLSYLLVNVTIMNVMLQWINNKKKKHKQNQWNAVLTFNTLCSFWDKETNWNQFPPLKIACAVYNDDDDDCYDISHTFNDETFIFVVFGPSYCILCVYTK